MTLALALPPLLPRGGGLTCTVGVLVEIVPDPLADGVGGDGDLDEGQGVGELGVDGVAVLEHQD